MNDTARLLERLAETFPDRPAPLPDLVAAAHAGQRRRTRRTVALAAVACVLAIGAGVMLQQVLPDDGVRQSDRVADTREVCDRSAMRTAPSAPIAQGPDFPINAAGQTYGSGATHRPDLVAVVGDCGRVGYVLSNDFDEPPPWFPGAGGTEPSVLTVYESDGTTQVDTYTREGARRPSPTPPTGPDAADVEGTWTATIAGITYQDGKEQYDIFRDLDLWITFSGASVQAHDGCQTLGAGYTLAGGKFALTTPFELELQSGTTCRRSAPITSILANIRYVTQSGGQTYLNLANYRIAVSLTPR